MKRLIRIAAILLAFSFSFRCSEAQDNKPPAFQPVPALGYRVVPNFFHPPEGLNVGEASGIALNSKGHIFLFQRAKPILTEYDEHGKFLPSFDDDVFTHPHGVRIDRDDNIWTTDDGSHLVLKLNPEGHVLLVLGRKGVAAESDWLFNQPTDVAFGKNGEVYVSDGYGNSRVVKFDRDGKIPDRMGQIWVWTGRVQSPPQCGS